MLIIALFCHRVVQVQEEEEVDGVDGEEEEDSGEEGSDEEESGRK